MSELDMVMATLRKEKANSKPPKEHTEDLCTDNVGVDTIAILSKETTGGTVVSPKNAQEGTTIMSEPLWAHAESHIGGGYPC